MVSDSNSVKNSPLKKAPVSSSSINSHALSYKNLAVSWRPENTNTRLLYIITVIVLAVTLVLALVVSVINVPPKERQVKKPIPERVAKFITQKKKPEVVKPKPKPTPPPKPIPKPKPKVVREKQTQAEKKKPLTVVEKNAREKAADSGLLALSSELADLFDTSDVSAQVGAKVKKGSSKAKTAASINTDMLTSGTTKGSGGANNADYVGGVGTTTLSSRDVALVKQSLLKSDQVEKANKGKQATRSRTGNVRSEEEVSMVFDQNKGQLFSIYNRERRKNPSLKGKIVLELTIAPNGTVTKVRIASSELNDPALERRLLARIKNFKFSSGSVEQVTVTFPIEFLPS